MEEWGRVKVRAAFTLAYTVDSMPSTVADDINAASNLGSNLWLIEPINQRSDPILFLVYLVKHSS